MTPKTFRYELDNGIGRITLDRPKTLNSLTFDVYGELRDFFSWLEDDRKSRVIVITGEGKGFCSGGDFHEIIKVMVSTEAGKNTPPVSGSRKAPAAGIWGSRTSTSGYCG